MSPAELVRALEDAGARLRVSPRGDRVDLEAEVEPPKSLLDELTRRAAEVLAFLQSREAPPMPVHVVDRRASSKPEPEPVPGDLGAPDSEVWLPPGCREAFDAMLRRVATTDWNAGFGSSRARPANLDEAARLGALASRGADLCRAALGTGR